MRAVNETDFVLSFLGGTILPVIGGLVMPSLTTSAGLSGLLAFSALSWVLRKFLTPNELLPHRYATENLALALCLDFGIMNLLSMITGQHIWPAIFAGLLGVAVFLGLVLIGYAIIFGFAYIAAVSSACVYPRSDADNALDDGNALDDDNALNPVMLR